MAPCPLPGHASLGAGRAAKHLFANVYGTIPAGVRCQTHIVAIGAGEALATRLVLDFFEDGRGVEQLQ